MEQIHEPSAHTFNLYNEINVTNILDIHRKCFCERFFQRKKSLIFSELVFKLLGICVYTETLLCN